MSGRPRAAAVPSGFFVLRTPLLPFSQAVAWGGDVEAAAHLDDGTLPEALARDRAMLRRRLEDVVGGPEFRDAVFIASPSLEAAIDGWRKDPDSERGRSAEQALVAYFLRAAARPTPFGLFAGCSTGRLGNRTDLRLGERSGYRRHTRLDMDYLWALAAAIEKQPDLRRELLFRPNSSLYEVGERLLFAEARQDGDSRSYQLVAVEKTPYLAQTLERARAGARLSGLAEALIGDDITRADADDYLDELVSNQVLVSDVRPQVTGPPPTETLVATLHRATPTVPLADRLGAAAGALRTIDDAGLGAAPQQYRDVAAMLAELPAAPDLSRFVQVDLTKPAPGLTLGEDVVDELLRGVDILHAFGRPPADDALQRFRDQFTRRYETREVPLAVALDEENGIGFDRSTAPSAEAAPLLAGLPLSRRDERPGRWTALDGRLLDRLAGALAAGRREIELDGTDVERARTPDAPPLPDAFEVLAEVVSPSAEALARGDFHVVMTGVAGPSGVRLVGRFCHADEQLHQLAVSHLRAEEAARPDAVFAEVVHLPEGRVGNILSRPVLRDYEIPFLGRSGAAPDRQLDLSDLLVSVDGERIVLRSRRLGREVLPRLTTAHQHARGLGVYRFLCALQHQGARSGLFWDWGPLASAPFLPRVTSGRVVLARARWNLGREDLSAFAEPAGPAQFAAVQRLRARHGLPRYVALADADNELLVDLENVLSVEALARQVRRRNFATLSEITRPEHLCVTGPEGRFASQVLVPFVRPISDRPPAARPPRTLTSVRRRFPPGSEWLYLKLFTGPATADRVLDRAGAAMETAVAGGVADRWFFLRYGDPDWHVRVRVHGRPDALLGEVLPLLNSAVVPLTSAGQLWRVELGTYEREVERYGGDRGIELAEEIFWADSVAALEIVRQLPGDAGADLRWRAGLLGIDRLFDDLGLSLDDRRAVAGTARRGYGEEFGAGRTFHREVGLRFRRERRELERVLDPAGEPVADLAACTQAVRQRSTALAPLGEAMRSLDRAGHLTVPMTSLAMSLAHMHVNRVLRSAQRAQELVLYEMLDRIYSSRAARRAG